jgi:hypothetical protein
MPLDLLFRQFSFTQKFYKTFSVHKYPPYFIIFIESHDLKGSFILISIISSGFIERSSKTTVTRAFSVYALFSKGMDGCKLMIFFIFVFLY